jgi:hypothetical protein
VKFAKIDPAKLHGIPILVSVLAADAMYFQAARNALSRAAARTRRIDRARSRVESLQDRIDALSQSPDGEKDHDVAYRNYSKLEPLCIQLEGAEYQLGEAYGPMLQDLATVHLVCAACCEAHINVQAQARLHGREWDAFERLAVDAKWLFLPKLLGLAGFDAGKEPFQAFDALLRSRNRLAHFRFHKEHFASPGVPGFVGDLGLTIKSAEKSLGSVDGMVSELARQLGQDRPHWLTVEDVNFFEVIVE